MYDSPNILNFAYFGAIQLSWGFHWVSNPLTSGRSSSSSLCPSTSWWALNPGGQLPQHYRCGRFAGEWCDGNFTTVCWEPKRPPKHWKHATAIPSPTTTATTASFFLTNMLCFIILLFSDVATSWVAGVLGPILGHPSQGIVKMSFVAPSSPAVSMTWDSWGQVKICYGVEHRFEWWH